MPDQPPQRPPVDFRARDTWIKIGYGLSAAWMLLVVVLSGGDASDPWFDYIFIVPLIGWALALGIEAIVKRMSSPKQ